MATLTLAKSPLPEIPQPDSPKPELITELVERVMEKKPVQGETDDSFQRQNEQMLNALWAAGESMNLQAFEIPVRKRLDPLTVALNGFPDVNTYYAYQEGN